MLTRRLAMLALALVGACRPTPPPAPSTGGPASSTEPTPAASTVAERPLYEAAALAEHIDDVYLYPPTACRLQALLGDDAFAELKGRGGAYPPYEPDREGGFAYFGSDCPQPYCNGAVVWVHPGGAMVVAVQSSERVEVHTNRPELRERPPAAIASFLRDVRARLGGGDPEVSERWNTPAAARTDPAACRQSAVAKRTARFLAVRAGKLCDPDYSSVSGAAAVAPRAGDRTHFVRGPRAPELPEHVSRGVMVRLGRAHADDDQLLCAEHTTLAGERTVGWLPRADLRVIDPSLEPSVEAGAALVEGVHDDPSWLGPTAVRLGDLAVRATATGEVAVELERVMAGHLCTVTGTLSRPSSRIFVGSREQAGCEVVGVLFDNGVYLWEDGECSGARASCTDAYVTSR